MMTTSCRVVNYRSSAGIDKGLVIPYCLISMTYQQQKKAWAKRRQAMARLFSQGQSVAAIAKRYGISRQRVYQAINNG